MQEERKAYNSNTKPNIVQFQNKFNQTIQLEISTKITQYRNQTNFENVEKIITHADVLCKKNDDGEFDLKTVFQDE